MRYLVAVDGWEPSHRALEFAAQQASETGGTLDVVHVVAEGGGNEASIDQVREVVEEMLGDVDVEFEFHVLEADKRTKPAKKVGVRVLEFVEEGGHDLVVVGNESTGTAERMIVGSVARTIIDDRGVPVLLVP